MSISTIEEGVEDLRLGKAIVVVDDADRENEGDLMVAAEAVTPEHINFMAKHAGGLVCMPVPGERLDALQLPQMVTENTARHGTPFTVPVDVKEGATTGISAYDRAATVKAILDPNTKSADLARPGHLFPLRYTNGGVLGPLGKIKLSEGEEVTVQLVVSLSSNSQGVYCVSVGPLGKIKLSEGEEVTVQVETKDGTPTTNDSQSWLGANLSEKLPPYEWGQAGLPKVKPVKYSRGLGFVIDDGK